MNTTTQTQTATPNMAAVDEFGSKFATTVMQAAVEMGIRRGWSRQEMSANADAIVNAIRATWHRHSAELMDEWRNCGAALTHNSVSAMTATELLKVQAAALAIEALDEAGISRRNG